MRILLAPGATTPAGYAGAEVVEFPFDDPAAGRRLGDTTCEKCGLRLDLHLWQVLGEAAYFWDPQPVIDCATI